MAAPILIESNIHNNVPWFEKYLKRVFLLESIILFLINTIVNVTMLSFDAHTQYQFYEYPGHVILDTPTEQEHYDGDFAGPSHDCFNDPANYCETRRNFVTCPSNQVWYTAIHCNFSEAETYYIPLTFAALWTIVYSVYILFMNSTYSVEDLRFYLQCERTKSTCSNTIFLIAGAIITVVTTGLLVYVNHEHLFVEWGDELVNDQNMPYKYAADVQIALFMVVNFYTLYSMTSTYLHDVDHLPKEPIPVLPIQAEDRTWSNFYGSRVSAFEVIKDLETALLKGYVNGSTHFIQRYGNKEQLEDAIVKYHINVPSEDDLRKDGSTSDSTNFYLKNMMTRGIILAPIAAIYLNTYNALQLIASASVLTIISGYDPSYSHDDPQHGIYFPQQGNSESAMNFWNDFCQFPNAYPNGYNGIQQNADMECGSFMNDKFCEYGVIFTSYSCGDFSEQPVFYATLTIWLFWGFLAFCLSLHSTFGFGLDDLRFYIQEEKYKVSMPSKMIVYLGYLATLTTLILSLVYTVNLLVILDLIMLVCINKVAFDQFASSEYRDTGTIDFDLEFRDKIDINPVPVSKRRGSNLWGYKLTSETIMSNLEQALLLSYIKNDKSYLTVFGDPDSLTEVLKRVHLHFSQLESALELTENVKNDQANM